MKVRTVMSNTIEHRQYATVIVHLLDCGHERTTAVLLRLPTYESRIAKALAVKRRKCGYCV